MNFKHLTTSVASWAKSLEDLMSELSVDSLEDVKVEAGRALT